MLKGPVKPEELEAEYDADTTIDKENLDFELLKIPGLTSKYLSILSHHRRVMHSLDDKYRVMRERRASYYRGEFCLEDLEKEGWEQFQGNPIRSPTIMKETLDNDPVLVPILLKKQLNQVVINHLELIIKELNNRGYNLKAAIEHRKFFKGVTG